MPNTSATAKPKRPSKEEPIERRPFPLLEPGIYVLTQDWVHARPDNRLAGRGVFCPGGYRKGTRFRVREETERFERDKQILTEMGATARNMSLYSTDIAEALGRLYLLKELGL